MRQFAFCLHAVLVALSASWLAACIDAAYVPCGDLLCPYNYVCVASGCATLAEVEACQGKAENEQCDNRMGQNGVCWGGACRTENCGNHLVEGREVCDDGNLISGDGCSSRCDSLEVCGNEHLDTVTGENCDRGAANADTPNALCRANCQLPACGDGIIDDRLNEQCDNGAANSDEPDADCRRNCLPKRCGDGRLDPSRNEVCDDGNIMPNDGCSGDCLSNETCGNGYVDQAKGEHCDDGNQNDQDNCRNNCTIPGCGDGVHNPAGGEGCDLGAANSNSPDAACRINCQPQRCGDGIMDSGEVCDDGNIAAGDGCAPDCKSREICGDGIVSVATGEQCDDGNGNNGDACHTDCTVPRCGDGVWDAQNGEACDAGAANANTPNAPCRTNCQAKRCGDMVVDAGEVCDDGNLVSGDRCSGDCRSLETCGNDYVDAAVGELCDSGIAGLGRDGCTSTCQQEVAVWQNVSPRIPIQHDGYAIAYDAARRTIVMHGGGPTPSGETWTWDGVAWTLHHPMVAPGTRRYGGAAYDANRQRVVLFGGYNALLGELADTWEWNGTTWRQVMVTGPAKRKGFGITYDSAKRRVVIVGGYTGDGDVLYNDVWTFDGAAWTQVAVGALKPSGRLDLGFAYDPVRDECILFGGNVGGTTSNETWRLKLSSTSAGTWTLLSPATRPSARAMHGMAWNPLAQSGQGRIMLTGSDNGDWQQAWEWSGTNWVRLPDLPQGVTDHRMAFDANRGRMMYWEGSTTPAFSAATEWNGSSWQRITPLYVPSDHSGGRGVFDVKRGRLVLFGGTRYGAPGNALVQETSEFDGHRWHVYNAANFPPGRSDTAMAFDATRGLTVMFGGSIYPAQLNDTWTWDGTTWRDINPATKPPARIWHTLGFDNAANEMVLYGGYCETCPGRGDDPDTWTFNGTNWTRRITTQVPPARRNAAMAFDYASNKLLLFGGQIDNTNVHRNDVWEWSNGQWTERVVSNPPPARALAVMVWDHRRNAIVIQGGVGDGWLTLTDSWELRGNAWTQIAPLGFGPADNSLGMYDSVGGRILQFNSRDQAVWSLGWQANTAGTDTCVSATVDSDGDGLLGCLDPDCAGLCTPRCLPNTTCLTGASANRCGDGVCDTNLETYLLCPADCAPPP